MQIIPLSEGSFTVDASKKFVPFNKATDQLSDRPAGSLLVEVQPFVVRTKKDVLVFDTGLGFNGPSGRLQIHENLAAQGIQPEDVSKVILSHLHKDHAGGISTEDAETGKAVLSFPSASYYIHEREFEFALDKNNKSYTPADFNVLAGNPSLRLLNDEGSIDGYIHYQLSGGHCPYHTVFRVEEAGKTGFFGGDVAPQLQQMKNRFVAKYDFDGKRSMELRQQWWEQGKAAHWTFMFYHDIKTPTVSY